MIFVYHNTRCSKSRAALDFLAAHAPDQEIVIIDYLANPPSASELRDLLKRGQLSPKDALRTSEEAYRALALDERVGEDDLIELMVDNPMLIQRPIVATNKGVVIARPTEKIMEVL
jgi:hypothetical protein